MVFNETCGDKNWKVVTWNPKKFLSISTKNAEANNVIKALGKVGYDLEVLVKMKMLLNIPRFFRFSINSNFSNKFAINIFSCKRN